MLCHQIPCPIQQWASVFPILPFDVFVPAEMFSIALHIHLQIQLPLVFGFPNLITCSDNVSTLLLCDLTLLLSLLCFLFKSEFNQELSVDSWMPLDTFV